MIAKRYHIHSGLKSLKIVFVTGDGLDRLVKHGVSYTLRLYTKQPSKRIKSEYNCFENADCDDFRRIKIHLGLKIGRKRDKWGILGE